MAVGLCPHGPANDEDKIDFTFVQSRAGVLFLVLTAAGAFSVE